MSELTQSGLSEAVTEFLDAVSQTRPYRMLSKGEVPTIAEHKLYEAIRRLAPLSEEAVCCVRQRLNVDQAYFLVNFARRMAVHAARTKDLAMLMLCAYGFVFDDGLVEWRDIMMDLAIIEDCCGRLGTNIESVMCECTRLASGKRRNTIGGYLSRPSEMRGLKVMKIAVSGEGTELTYSRIPW